MNDYKAEETINNIRKKLYEGEQLDAYEIATVVTALMKVNNVKQAPYYEVVYHDEYDRQERRIMEPISCRLRDDGHLKIREDRFELNFRRLLQ